MDLRCQTSPNWWRGPVPAHFRYLMDRSVLFKKNCGNKWGRMLLKHARCRCLRIFVASSLYSFWNPTFVEFVNPWAIAADLARSISFEQAQLTTNSVPTLSLWLESKANVAVLFQTKPKQWRFGFKHLGVVSTCFNFLTSLPEPKEKHMFFVYETSPVPRSDLLRKVWLWTPKMQRLTWTSSPGDRFDARYFWFWRSRRLELQQMAMTQPVSGSWCG